MGLIYGTQCNGCKQQIITSGYQDKSDGWIAVVWWPLKEPVPPPSTIHLCPTCWDKATRAIVPGAIVVDK